jgi:predicted membrane protein
LRELNRRILEDRRKQPTPALSRFTVRGLRRSFRRKEEQKRGGYIDRYGSGLLFLIVLIVGFNVMDAWLTMIILKDGGWEINPVVSSVIQLYGDRFWIWKFAIVSVPLILLCLHSKFRLAVPAIWAISFFYMIAVLFQILLTIC